MMTTVITIVVILGLLGVGLKMVKGVIKLAVVIVAVIVLLGYFNIVDTNKLQGSVNVETVVSSINFDKINSLKDELLSIISDSDLLNTTKSKNHDFDISIKAGSDSFSVSDIDTMTETAKGLSVSLKNGAVYTITDTDTIELLKLIQSN